MFVLKAEYLDILEFLFCNCFIFCKMTKTIQIKVNGIYFDWDEKKKQQFIKVSSFVKVVHLMKI